MERWRTIAFALACSALVPGTKRAETLLETLETLLETLFLQKRLQENGAKTRRNPTFFYFI